MPEAPILWREPEFFVAGDSLIFQRNLPDYLPSDGWSIRLTVTQPTANGGVEVAQINSAPDPTNTFHQFNIPAFCAGQPNGVYILSEEVINVAGNAGDNIAAGEKHQIYFNDNFVIGPDLADGPVAGELQTEAQQMLTLISSTLKELYASKFAETDVQRSRFLLQKIGDVLKDYKFWTAKRQEEIQQDRVRAGRPSGAVADAVFNIG